MPQTIAQIQFSDINKLFDEIFHLRLDKIQLESEIERLKIIVDMYKAMAFGISA